jgi:uncharacterized membrane protein YesL
MNDILNNKFYEFFNRMANLFILSLLWLIACIPIITIFPATASMYSVIRQWKLYEETSVFKPFLKYFKFHFKKSLLFEIIWVLVSSILLFDFVIIFQYNSEWFIPIKILLFVIAFFFLFINTFLFPIIVQYDLKFWDIIKNIFIISIAYFPTTLLIITIGSILLLVLYILPISIVFLIGLFGYLHFHFCHRVFIKIEHN